MDWQIGIICPYNEILYSSGKLYFMLFLSMGLGLLCLFIGIVNIVKRLSSPLLELAYSTRRVAEGQFDIVLPIPKSCKEIYDLYDSFHYLQQNLVNYIERLKITTAEKEQYNTTVVAQVSPLEILRWIKLALGPVRWLIRFCLPLGDGAGWAM